MATAEELQKKLQNKLRELFQLDQPDLDFGFYRVMHAKAKRVNEYLNADLPNKINAAFASTNLAKLKGDFDAAKEAFVNGLGNDAISDDGTVNPAFAAVPLAKQYIAAKEAYEGAQRNGDAESDIYDHLYHFFERYYDKGDFVSLRYLTRETDHKAMPYAIPYAGEEVKLHWANADQYYIKTSENFSRFTFDAAQHPDVLKMNAMAKMAAKVPESFKIHFEIVDAEEGDHGNIKQGKERFFILHDAKKCEVKDGELYVYFEYRDDSEKTGSSGKWQEKRRAEALAALKTELVTAGLTTDQVEFLFLDLNDGDKKKGERILLDVYLRRYMARNTADYFIHKDLGGFLRRELDFYIKNDLMILDDVTAATPETVAKWLGKTKIFREIALDIISFLAQLEDFQKKLCLKRKFVVQCDYCITMDRIPDNLKEEVLSNQKQLDEWKRLGINVDPKAADMMAIDARMVDTQFFDDMFKQKLLASIEDFDEQCDGLLIYSDNFQALKLIQESYRDRIKCIYIDPPYNTGSDGFLYRDGYKDSSWLSMIESVSSIAEKMFSSEGALFTSLDYNENFNYRILIETCLRQYKFVGEIHWESKTKSQNTETAFNKLQPKVEIVFVHSRSSNRRFNLIRKGEKSYPYSDARGKYREHVMELMNAEGVRGRESMIFSITDGVSTVSPPEGKQWKLGQAQVAAFENAGDILIRGEKVIVKMRPEYERTEKTDPFWGFFDKSIGTTESAKSNLSEIIPKHGFETVKPKAMVERLVYHGAEKSSIILDYFGGSGTTAHAVIDLNREDKGKRKYILIEMGDHFNTVLKPRIEKVVYSPDWKAGRPEVTNKGVSHCFKYLRLESYEDTLNNLIIDEEKGAAFSGIGDYFFKYMLDVETKGSPSLLSVKEFAKPFDYKLMIKKPASEEREEKTVDLVETFNYLLGLRVKKTYALKRFDAEFERKIDPELPGDQNTKLTVKGNIKPDAQGLWKFRLVEGWQPKNRFAPNDGAKEKVLVVWRNLTGVIEKDNAVLDAFLKRSDINALDGEFDVIYVNGSNNVPNLRKDGDDWKVQSIEETFFARMWEGA